MVIGTKATTKQKPRKWSRRNDGKCCIGCEKPFKSGDMVYTHGAFCVHANVDCLTAYRDSLIEIGILKIEGER